MVIKLYGSEEDKAVLLAKELIQSMGHTIDSSHYIVDLGVAPLLKEKVAEEEILQFWHGLLVFHPSLLPHRRGPSAIKHAILAGDIITGATWFWANSKLDAGDICEMEVIRINHLNTFREFYEQDIIPALLRTLARALSDISNGYVRRIPQVESYASYDPKI